MWSWRNNILANTDLFILLRKCSVIRQLFDTTWLVYLALACDITLRQKCSAITDSWCVRHSNVHILVVNFWEFVQNNSVYMFPVVDCEVLWARCHKAGGDCAAVSGDVCESRTTRPTVVRQRFMIVTSFYSVSDNGYIVSAFLYNVIFYTFYIWLLPLVYKPKVSCTRQPHITSQIIIIYNLMFNVHITLC